LLLLQFFQKVTRNGQSRTVAGTTRKAGLRRYVFPCFQVEGTNRIVTMVTISVEIDEEFRSDSQACWPFNPIASEGLAEVPKWPFWSVSCGNSKVLLGRLDGFVFNDEVELIASLEQRSIDDTKTGVIENRRGCEAFEVLGGRGVNAMIVAILGSPRSFEKLVGDGTRSEYEIARIDRIPKNFWSPAVAHSRLVSHDRDGLLW